MYNDGQKSGTPPSTPRWVRRKWDQQAVSHAQLNEFKSEIEAGYDRYWQGSGDDWRPLKSVAKGVLQQTGESES